MESRLLARMSSTGTTSTASKTKSSIGRLGAGKEKIPIPRAAGKKTSLRSGRDSSSSLLDATRREFLRSNTRLMEPSSPSLSAAQSVSSPKGRPTSKSMLHSPSPSMADVSPRMRGDQMHALEQKLRDRAEISKLKEENRMLQAKLEELSPLLADARDQAWASRESVQDVMETECRTLAQRMQEMEDQLCDVRTERDQLTKDLQILQEQLLEMKTERDELTTQLQDTTSRSGGWEQALGDIHAELEVVREERTILKEELHASLLKQHEVEQECFNLKEERELLEEEVVALMEAGESDQPTLPAEVSKQVFSPEVTGPQPLAGLEMIPEPEDQLDLTLLAEHILLTLQQGDELIEQQALILLKAAYAESMKEPRHSIIEMSTATDWAEINVDKLWEIIEINGYPEGDNQYIFNGDFLWHDTPGCLELVVALFALKVQQPDYVHILHRNSMDLMQESTKLELRLLNIMARHLPFGAVLNNEVLILHKELFDDAVSAHNTAPVPNADSRRFTNTLIPDPVDTKSDPVFMQQLKGLEASTDATVAIIRVTPSAVMTPDNARFLMFRSTHLFKCIDYFANDPSGPSTSASLSPAVLEEAKRWAKPRKDKDSTTKRSIPAPRSSIPKPAPKLAYNAPARERQRKTEEVDKGYRKKTGALPRSGLPAFKSKR